MEEMNSSGIRSQRLQYMLKMKYSGATESQLLDHAITHYGVTNETAKDYTDTVLRRWKISHG
jgi:hypothetical protein